MNSTRYCAYLALLRTLTQSTFYFQKTLCLGTPHVDSFDHFIDVGLAQSVRGLNPIEFALPSGDQVSITIANCVIQTPAVPLTVVGTSSRHIYPRECRQRKISYRGKCTVQLKWSVNGIPCPSIEKEMGEMPVMLKVSVQVVITIPFPC